MQNKRTYPQVCAQIHCIWCILWHSSIQSLLKYGELLIKQKRTDTSAIPPKHKFGNSRTFRSSADVGSVFGTSCASGSLKQTEKRSYPKLGALYICSLTNNDREITCFPYVAICVNFFHQIKVERQIPQLYWRSPWAQNFPLYFQMIQWILLQGVAYS